MPNQQIEFLNGSLESDRNCVVKMLADYQAVPFVPYRFLKRGDAQTVGAHFWPGRFRPRDLTGDENRLFEVEPGSRVLARCRWHSDRLGHPTLVIWHGMEGSTASAYMLSIAAKAFRAGFNTVRVNFRNCGGTEQLTPTLYHGGLSADIRAVINELIEKDQLTRVFIGGVSLGGNQILKAAGEYGKQPPTEVKALCAISPSADLKAGCEALMLRRNWIYHQRFLLSLKSRVKEKEKHFAGLYDSSRLEQIRTIREFDDVYIAPAFGFADADDYYAKASSLPFLKHIRIPTLLIHAQDDPFIPFAPLRDQSIAANPYLRLLATEHGGHVGFIAQKSRLEDRFWAENRLIEFGRLMMGRVRR